VIVGERLSATGWLGVVLVVACLVCITIPTRGQKTRLEVPEPST